MLNMQEVVAVTIEQMENGLGMITISNSIAIINCTLKETEKYQKELELYTYIDSSSWYWNIKIL